MEEGFTRREKLVGLFLLVMVIITKVTLLVIAQGKGWFLPQKTYQVIFKEGYNLHQGSLVKMYNTEIGKVSRMRIVRVMDEPQVEVTIRVLKEYTDLICQDSVAEVVSPTFIGSEYLKISPGTKGYPRIEDGGQIPSQARKSMMENLADLVNEEAINKVKNTLNNLAQLSEQLKNDEKAMLAAVTNFGQVATSLTEGKGTLGLLLTERDFYNRMNESMSQLSKVLADAQKVSGDLKPAAQNLQEFTKSINQQTATLKSILADLKGGSQEFPGLMESAGETTRGGKEVVDAVKANPLIRMTLPQGPKSQSLHVEPRNAP
jgi:phospholipid/cholesterol/gamma-HCH transport system substrate-binding protein